MVAFYPTLVLIQTTIVLDYHGTIDDMVPRILRFLGIWCITDREIKSYLQYERCLCNFNWIFVAFLPTLLLMPTALVLDWHGTVDDMVPRILRFLGALSANLIYKPSGSYKMRDAFVTLTEYFLLFSPYLSTRRECHSTWLTWYCRWNGTKNSKVLGHWAKVSHCLSYIHIAQNYNWISFPAKKLFFFFFFYIKISL